MLYRRHHKPLNSVSGRGCDCQAGEAEGSVSHETGILLIHALHDAWQHACVRGTAWVALGCWGSSGYKQSMSVCIAVLEDQLLE